MATVRINTSDTAWIARRKAEAVASGTDCKGAVNFQVEIEVAGVEHVKFARASMIRFDIGPDAPRDHNRHAMYPESYLVDA